MWYFHDICVQHNAGIYKAIPFLISANPVVEIPLELVEVDLLYDPLLFAALTH